MKLLTAPYGHPDGIGIHLYADPEQMPLFETLKDVLLGYSCWPPAVPKIYSALKHSGRYDCRLAGSWFSAQFHQVVEHLLEIGVYLSLQDGENLSFASI